jgi:hypothetical protein
MGPYCPTAAATAGPLLHEYPRHVVRQPAERDAAAALVGCAHEHDTIRRQFDRAVHSRVPRRAASE